MGREGALVVKTAFDRDVGNHASSREKSAGCIETYLGKVGVRRQTGCSFEKTDELILSEICRHAQVLQRKRITELGSHNIERSLEAAAVAQSRFCSSATAPMAEKKPSKSRNDKLVLMQQVGFRFECPVKGEDAGNQGSE
jgi:hypothetical protein